MWPTDRQGPSEAGYELHDHPPQATKLRCGSIGWNDISVTPFISQAGLRGLLDAKCNHVGHVRSSQRTNSCQSSLLSRPIWPSYPHSLPPALHQSESALPTAVQVLWDFMPCMPGSPSIATAQMNRASCRDLEPPRSIRSLFTPRTMPLLFILGS